MTPQLARAQSPEPRPRLRDDLAWGARQGAFYAAAFSALGVLGYCLGDGGFRSELRVKALGCVAVYWFTGAIGGLLIGAFRSRLGQLGVALAVGAAVGVCFAMACVVLGEGPRARADRRMWAAGGCTGVLLGVLCVALSWSRWRAASSEAGGDAPVV